ncbi:hypothetical protein GCM10009861_12260 [Neomicrococcus aestuarii]
MWEEVEGKWRTLGSVSAKGAHWDALWRKIGRTLGFFRARGGKWGDFGMLPTLIDATFASIPATRRHTPSMRGHFSATRHQCEASSLQPLACENDLRLELAENL